MKIRWLKVGALAVLTAGVAHGAVFTVTNTNDAGAGSLRAALLDNLGSGGTNQIVFAPGVSGTITLGSSLPTLAEGSVSIVGPGSGVLTIDGNSKFRAFSVGAGGTAYTGAISGLTVANAVALGGAGGVGTVGGGGGGGAGAGGAIFVNSNAVLTVRDVRFSGNTAQGGTGGSNVGPAQAGGGGGGGGLDGDGGAGGPTTNVGGGGGGVVNGGQDGDNGGGGANGGAGGGAGTATDGVDGPQGGGGGAGANGGRGGNGSFFGGGGGGFGAGVGGNGAALGGGGGGGGGGGLVNQAGGTAGQFGGAGGSGETSGFAGSGGGGAGLGGAIFVNQGGRLIMQDGSAVLANNAAAGGNGGNLPPGSTATAGAAGQGVGDGIFLNGVDLTADVASGQVVSIAAEIAGDGGVQKIGAGLLSLEGDQIYTGATQVDAGRLDVNGSITSPVTVGVGGTLGGRGLITGATIVNGTIAPGNSIGTLNIAGAFTQNAGSTYEVEISTLTADLISVSGTATLNGGTVQVKTVGSAFNANQSYRILTATGGVTGQFAGVATDPVLTALRLTPTLAFQANAVDLVLVSANSVFFSTNEPFNAVSVANTLNAAITANTVDQTLLNQLSIQTPAQLSNTFKRIAGDIHPSFVSAQARLANMTAGTISRRTEDVQNSVTAERTAGTGPRGDARVAMAAQAGLADLAGLPSVASPQPFRLHGDRNLAGWVRGFTSRGDVDGRLGTLDIDLKVEGAAFGIDKATSNGVFGAFGTFGQLGISQDEVGSIASSDSWQLGLYGSRHTDRHYVLGTVFAGTDDIRTRRNAVAGIVGGTASSSHDGDSFGAYIEAGCRRPQRPGFDLQPLASLQYGRFQQDAFTETGAGVLNMSVAEYTQNSLVGSLGLRAQWPFEGRAGRLTVPELRVRWLHDFDDDSPLAFASMTGLGSRPFVVRGTKPDADAAQIGAGFTTYRSNDWSCFGHTDLTLSGNQAAITSEAGVRLVW